MKGSAIVQSNCIERSPSMAVRYLLRHVVAYYQKEAGARRIGIFFCDLPSWILGLAQPLASFCNFRQVS